MPIVRICCVCCGWVSVDLLIYGMLTSVALVQIGKWINWAYFGYGLSQWEQVTSSLIDRAHTINYLWIIHVNPIRTSSINRTKKTKPWAYSMAYTQHESGTCDLGVQPAARTGDEWHQHTHKMLRAKIYYLGQRTHEATQGNVQKW